MKNRTAPARKIRLLLAFVSIVALIAVFTLAAQSAALRIVLIGDSTMCNYAASAYPWAGWGQELAFFFKPGSVTVTNKAIGGRSSRSFIEDGHWASTLAILQKGDFLFIQFGHNDRSTVAARHADTAQYRQYLTQYITESRAKGAIPVLVSPMNMNTWNGTTLREVFNEGANDYHAAMIRVATTLKVPFVDLEKKSATLFQSMGQAYITSYFFMTLAVNEYTNYPTGYSDGTHFQEMGAINIAKLVAEGIKELAADPTITPLANLLAPQYAVNVAMNKAGAGLITASGTYPAGPTITLKVIPNAGQTFLRWVNSANTALTTNTHYTFTMGSTANSSIAIYQGGTGIVVTYPAGPVKKTADRIAVTLCPSTRTAVVSSIDAMQSVSVLDIAGRTMLTQKSIGQSIALDLSGLNNGMYFVAVQTTGGKYTRPVDLWK
jgi:lysophospholipase L1-like esterase